MELIIHSKKYGPHIVYFDEEDVAQIGLYHWYIRRDRRNFYCVTNIQKDGKGTTLRMHRLLMKISEDIQVDHIDGNGLNNRRSNLRLCTNAQNNSNKGRQVNNISGFKGVSWHSATKKWQVFIQVNNKGIYGGRFKSKLDAANRYNQLAIEYHGEFAKLNKI